MESLYLREQKLNIKLSELDIQRIRHLRSKGYTLQELATEYSVTLSTIRYWTVPGVKEADIKRNKNRPERTTSEMRKRFRERKKLLIPTYSKLLYLEFKKKHPNYQKARYYQDIEKHREYSRRYYKKKKDIKPPII